MLSPHKILVVDDEERIRKSLSGLLQDNGYEVITAGSGPECLQIMSSQEFDLVILDIVMPEMSGIEVLQWIKEKYKDTEVIIITGYADKEKAVAAFRLGAYDFIEKPFESREILNTITHCLNQMELRKEVERKTKELADEKERLLVTLCSIGDGVIATDTEGKILLINKVAEELTGWNKEDAVGKPCSEVFHIINEKTRKIPEDPVTRVIRTGLIVGLANNTILIARDGTERIIADSGAPIKDRDGNIIGVVLVFRDVTARRKMEEGLLKSSKLESVGILAGGIAHEFNNILTTIIGYGKLLDEEMSKDDPLRHNVNMILTSSERAVNLIKGLLAFSRDQIITIRPVSLNGIIKDVEKLLLMVIGEDIELRTTLSEENIVVMADPGQIEQVLVNLATNSRDVMPDGGYLTITTELVELDEEFLKTIKYKKPGRYALISVADTGAGMDEKTAGRIFEPFFTTKEVGRGTGLGLSIVYGIIEQHNGYINVRSDLEKGTTFKIYLPVIKSDVEEEKFTAPFTPTGGTEVILLAEDDEEVRKLTKTVLDGSGYKVIEAIDGEDAIRKFIEDKDKIQLLILDVVMPKKNGKEAYNEIKKTKPNIKALFTSGYAKDIIHRKGFLEEGFSFISKPVSPRELLRKVREVLDK
ncbi:MAG: response regulator [Nitrospirota bacterium]|nr:response regulator [Nitrospirota bacterium]